MSKPPECTTQMLTVQLWNSFHDHYERVFHAITIIINTLHSPIVVGGVPS